MKRTQISFEPELLRRAHRRAHDLGISLAEYVRRLVSRDLEGGAPERDPGSVFDLGSSGGSDVSAEKDELIGDSFSRSRE